MTAVEPTWDDFLDSLSQIPCVTEAVLELECTPLQVTGALDDGRFFYLRSRFLRSQLGVGETPDAAVEATVFETPGRYFEVDPADICTDQAGLYGDFYAGMINPDQAVEVAAELFAVLRARCLVCGAARERIPVDVTQLGDSEPRAELIGVADCRHWRG